MDLNVLIEKIMLIPKKSFGTKTLITYLKNSITMAPVHTIATTNGDISTADTINECIMLILYSFYMVLYLQLNIINKKVGCTSLNFNASIKAN